MTPIHPPRGTSLLPDRLEAGPAREAQRYLVARVLEGESRSLSAASLDSLTIAERLRRLPASERTAIETRSGSAWRELSLLAENSIPEDFYAALYQAGRRAENEDRFEVAHRCYFFVSRWDGNGHPVPEHLRRQSRQRLEVLAGGGSTWDRLEFGLRRLPAQTLDPPFLIGMGGASLAARGLRLALLARAVRGGAATTRLFPRLFQAGLIATAESMAFVGAERSAAALLGEPRTAASAPEEWLRYAWPMFLATRLSGTAAGQLYRRRLAEGTLAGAPLRHRIGYGLATQASIFGGAYLLQNLESEAAASERRPRDAVAQALVWTLAFSSFNSLSGKIRPFRR